MWADTSQGRQSADERTRMYNRLSFVDTSPLKDIVKDTLWITVLYWSRSGDPSPRGPNERDIDCVAEAASLSSKKPGPASSRVFYEMVMETGQWSEP